MDLGPKSPKQWICRKYVRKNWALVNQTTNKVGLNDKIVKINKCKLNKIVIGKVRGDCSYILLLNLITSLVPDCYSVSLFISIPFSHFLFLFFILSSSFIFVIHEHAKWLMLILVSSAPSISSHVVAVRLIITVQVSPPH